MPVDERIKHYLCRINDLHFVETKSSCQGHFCKSLREIIFYYFRKDSDGYAKMVMMGRVKNPIVLLKFSDKTIRKSFVIEWIRHRVTIFKSNVYLYIVTPRNKHSIKHLHTNSFIISSFGDKFVSVSYAMPQAIGKPYYKKKKRYDATVALIRDQLFELVISVLKEIEEA